MKLSEHERLLLPYDPPLPATIGGQLPAIPHLWERTKLMFARVIDHIGSTASFATRWRLTRAAREEVLGWLEPVEKTARACLIVRAFNFLMMSPEGRKLMQETPKMAMPEPPKPPGHKPASVRSTKIPMPGWHTIAQNQRALAEQRKLDAEREAQRAARDRFDPASWGGGFRVVGWTFPEPDEPAIAAPPARKFSRVGIEVIEPNCWPAPETPLLRPAPRREKDRPALILARRIEALARVLANPEPAVKRLARYFARLPHEALEALRDTVAFSRRHWRQGGDDPRLSAAHVRRAATTYCYIEPG